MAPKTEKRKSIKEENPVFLSDPINTDDWKCAVALLLERSPCDLTLTRMFSEEAAMEARKEVKSLDFDRDVMKILKEYMSGEASYRFAYLLNYWEAFEEATQYMKSSENIPVKVIVKIIKAFVFMLKKENIERRAKLLECNNDPIEIMRAKPTVSVLAGKGSDKKRESKGNNDKKKQQQKKSADVKATKVRVKTPEVTKEDTRLLRRGDQAKDFCTVDDAPQDTYFDLYIVLTGFREPELALEMVKGGIPLHGVFCLSSSDCNKSTSIIKTNLIDLDKYWTKFLQVLWSREYSNYFSDVVFQLYKPVELPVQQQQLRKFIYREISFLMYDLSELKHQLMRYHRHMRLWNVDALSQEVDSDQNYVQELEQLPYECMNIPVILQHIVDWVCGEDYPEEYEEETPSNERSSSVSPSSSSFSTSQIGDYESKNSFTSLIPFSSTVKLPTPRWSTVIDNNEKQTIYKKFLALDQLYGVEEYLDAHGLDVSSYKINVCVPNKRRLRCENLDVEIQNYSDGLLAKFWRNYPKQVKCGLSNMRGINFPELMVNYILYILWVGRTDRALPEAEVKSITDSSSELSRTKFTVTDGSRIALHKAFRTKDFFSPSHLKIIPPETLVSVSEPQVTYPPKFSWTEKSFVSDSHIPAKYLAGIPMEVFEDLRKFMGEEHFSHMKDYDFIEELSKFDLIQRIEDLTPAYDCIHHAYSPLTDSIYVFMYNNSSLNGVQRNVYNVMLRTPVGLRDFHDYVLDDEREWINKQKEETQVVTRWDSCPISMYNPTPCFRGFTEYDFWHENSIKYMTRAKEVLQSVIEKVDSSGTENAKKGESKVEAPSSVYAQSGEPYTFVGFDFEPGAIQYSGVETTFKGPDGCSVRVSLQERLYGTQQLGLHVQQGGHTLHLYSFVCPQAHLDQPHTFHIECKNGIIIAFSRRMFPEGISTDGNSIGSFKVIMEDDKFAYDMKLSFPHGLTVETVRQHVHPCYIKQSYIIEGSSNNDEKSRLFLPNGSVVKITKNNTVEVLNADTSIVSASLNDLAFRSNKAENEETHSENGSLSRWLFRSYSETMRNGCRYTVVDDKILETTRFQIIKNTSTVTEERYFRRMDSTRYVILADGTTCVEFPDGTKISTSLLEENLCVEDDVWYGEEATGDMYITVHMNIVMEHPDYATVIYNGRSSNWQILLPGKAEIEIESNGCHHVHLDGQTELDVSTEAIRMWRYNAKDEFVMSITADLTAFEKQQPREYCTAIDSMGRRFVTQTDGNCYITENDDRSSGFEDQAEGNAEPQRYFVVRRDLTGFEIIHTQNVKREMEAIGPEVLALTQELNTTPVTRYFALLKKAKVSPNKWMVESITPNTKFCVEKLKTSSTYGKPPSWMHPFPKKKAKQQIPQPLEGRILFETKQTKCSAPSFSSADYAFCDTSHFQQSNISLTDNVPSLMRKVADQDQDVLKELFFAAVRQRAESKKLMRPANTKLEKYLDDSKYHVKFREYLRDSIRQKKIIGYFEHPRGMAWLIIQSIIDKFADVAKPTVEAPPVTQRTDSSKESSEVEYNIDWSSDPSYSDLSFRSDLSLKTAPGIKNLPICSKFLPAPRYTKSEPIYKLEENKKQDELNSGNYNFSFPSSEICVFTKQDINNLEETHNFKESEQSCYQLEDLMNLGLI